MEAWYIRKGEQVLGPLDLGALQRWAADGRIGPEDLVSRDQQQWLAAPTIETLAMHWLIRSGNGARVGPLHILALRDLMRTGKVPPTTTLQHRVTGEERPAGDVLLEALLEEDLRVQALLKESTDRVAKFAGAPAAPTAAGASPPAASRTGWAAEAEARFHFEREAQRWKNLYEELRAQSEREKGLLEERLRELRQGSLADRSHLEQAGLKIEQLERRMKLLQEAVESAGAGRSDAAQAAALIEAYSTLSRSHDQIGRQLLEKAREVQAVRETHALSEKQTDQRLRTMEELLQRNQADADQARRQATENEESYLELLQAYREMNDRYIRLRQGPEPSAGTARRDKPA